MNIWVDADACPKLIKEIIFRAAMRAQIDTMLLANHPMVIPKSPYIKFRQVAAGFDIADNEIVKLVNEGDLVITSDIPLAADVVDKNATALSPRGELFTRENVRSRLSMRDFLDTMRSSGVNTGGPPALSQSDRQAFANHLDRIIAASKK